MRGGKGAGGCATPPSVPDWADPPLSQPLHMRLHFRPGVLRLPLVLYALFSPFTLAAQDTSPDSLNARVLPEGAVVRLDGVLSEEFWDGVPVLDDLRQREPLSGEVPSERTEVRITFDDEAMYVGIVAFDRTPDDIVARVRQRDRIMSGEGFGISFEGDDVVSVVFDPFLDRRNGMLFATNPNGAQFDALLSNDGDEINSDWRGVWEVSVARSDEGWSAEFAIPWSTLRYPADSSRGWGFNVARMIQAEKEEVMWRSWELERAGFHRIGKAGRLTGLTGLPRPTMTVEVKPYALGGVRWTRPETGGDLMDETDAEVGIDLKSEVRPGLVLDLTVNTDFAQVEADDQQVNLTRFNLFFPEKREFFLENAGLFEFGQGGFGPPPFLMFFSRRIGITEAGPVPIVAGGRLTGRVGGQTVGLLSVATDGDAESAGEFFNVARIKRDVGESDYIGAMITDRRGDGPGNTVVGVDSRVLVTPTLLAEGFVARSFTEGVGGEGTALSAGLNYTTDLWGGFARFLQVGEGTEAASGFVSRTDYRNANFNLRRSFRPEILGLRKVDFRFGGSYATAVDGRFQERNGSVTANLSFLSGDYLTASVERGAEEVDEGFELADVLPVPNARYSTDEWSMRGSTAGSRIWSVEASVAGGDIYGGDLLRYGGSVTLAPVPALSFTTGFDRNHVELPSGELTADVTTLRLTWAFSTRITTNALIQYNSLADQLLSNVRFNFIHRPGSDLYLVFTEDRLDGPSGWTTQDRGFVVKLTYLMRL